MRKKFVRPVRAKSSGEGRVTAVISTLGVRDLDGDVLMPGAFRTADGGWPTVKLGTWNHTAGAPIGRGTIREKGSEAIFEGELWLDSPSARDHWIALREDESTEWSYVFNIVKSHWDTVNGKRTRMIDRVSVTRVDPVDQGAGIGTRTLMLKSKTLAGLSSKELGRHVDELLTAHLFDRLAAAEKVVEKHAVRKSGLRSYHAELAAEGHGPAWADAILESELQGRAQQLVNTFPHRFTHDPLGARVAALRQLEAELA